MTLTKLKQRLRPSIAEDGVKAIVWYDNTSQWKFLLYVASTVDMGYIVRKYTAIFDDIDDTKILFEATYDAFDKNSLGKGTLVYQEGAGTRNMWYTDMR